MYRRIVRGLLSMGLAAALLLSALTFPVNADELAPETEPTQETTQPPETTAPPTQPPEITAPPTQPPETTAPPTQPPETTAPPTQPPETTAPPTQPPETTAPPTQPPETTAAPTEPSETTVPPTDPPETTVPPTTQPQTPAPITVTEVDPVTVSWAKRLAAGTANVAVKGTIVFSGFDLTVLQDNTGGIALTLGSGDRVTPGEVVQVQGTRTAEGLSVEALTRKGTEALPAREVTLAAIPELTRVTVKNVSFHNGMLTQDAKSLQLMPSAPEGIAQGELVHVWGVLSGAVFYADTVVSAQPKKDPLPALTATPLGSTLPAGESIGLHSTVAGVSIFYSLSLDGGNYGEFLPYSGGIPVDAAVRRVSVRAYARKEGYDDSPETEFFFTREGGEEGDGTLKYYFGQLHAHTSISDGMGTVEDAFTYASNVPGLDFFAVTDHSNSFDNAEAGNIGADGSSISQEWKAGKEAAKSVTDADFVGIFGYEMSWQNRQKGHINTFHTPGWQAWGQEEFEDLESYYQALTTVPGSISQFNHPGTTYGSFDYFAYHTPQYDPYIQLLEVGSEFGAEAYQEYTRALDAGWHVAPTNNQANHDGSWGTVSEVRTVVLATALTEDALFDAIRSRRVYATQDSDLEIWYDLNGAIMGSTIREPARTVTVKLSDATDTAPAKIEVLADGGVRVAQGQMSSGGTLMLSVPGEYTYYYLRITQSDGDVAVTAPVWTDTTVDVGISAFAANSETPKQGQPLELTLNLYNNEQEDFLVQKLEVFLDGTLLQVLQGVEKIEALKTLAPTVPLLYQGLGNVEVKAVVSGTLGNIPHSFESTLTLCYQPETADTALSAISYTRGGTLGQVYRVEGYVTAGNSDPHNTFPGMIYLQDDTGGIGVAEFPAEKIVQVGTPLTVWGYLELCDGNPTLVHIKSELRAVDAYRYVPTTMYHSTAMNYDTYGGQLLQVEGQVVTLTRTADGKGISQMTLKDIRGDIATVKIEDAILSSASGTNTLASTIKAGSTVRAMGILHREADGTAVLRVRNCDEVVYVAPVADPTNPKTGDQWTCLPLYFWAAALGVYCHSGKKRRM